VDSGCVSRNLETGPDGEDSEALSISPQSVGSAIADYLAGIWANPYLDGARSIGVWARGMSILCDSVMCAFLPIGRYQMKPRLSKGCRARGRDADVIREGRLAAFVAVEGDGAAEHCQGIEHREGEFGRGYGAIPTSWQRASG
jgi:hypothetical protein